ncbi:MAG: hypothetical protein QOJ15_9225 [Bradyrhizobium sp.]|nr:hypothetical protein [Bradyrhizobium sp.]
MLAPGNPLLGRTLVVACHCTQCTKETPRFLRRGLAVGRSYAVKGSQIGHQTRHGEPNRPSCYQIPPRHIFYTEPHIKVRP